MAVLDGPERMLDEAGPGAHRRGERRETLAGSFDSRLVDADEEFAVGARGAFGAHGTVAAGGGLVIGVITGRVVTGFGVGLAVERFPLRARVAVGGGIVGEPVRVVEAVR